MPVSDEEETNVDETYSLADHTTYAESMYGQPSWVLEGVFQNAGFDPEQQYSKAQVQEALDDFLGQTDQRFGEQ